MKLAIISLKSNSSNMLIEASKKYFSEVDALDLRHIEIVVREKAEIFYEDEPLKDYDCIYCRGSSKYALILRSITEILNKKAYMPLAPESFTIAHDKFLTQLYLQKLKVDMPRTYLAATTKRAKELIKRIHYPAIIKLPSGTHGKGVMFADSRSSASSILDTLEIFRQAYIIQDFIDTDGKDIRAIVTGDEVIASMERSSARGELRANIHAGGKGKAITLTEEAKELAIKSARAIHADVCAVDILQGLKPLVIEVNASPGLKGITEATKKDVAGEIAKYLFEQSSKFAASKKENNYSRIIHDINQPGPKEVIANLDVKLGRIRLDSLITKLSGFTSEDEVTIKVERGNIIIKKHGDN